MSKSIVLGRRSFAKLLSVSTLVVSFSFLTAFADQEAGKSTFGIDVGKKSPNFELPVVDNDSFISLEDEYKKGPVVLIVLRGYPGYQCPLCNRQVGSLTNRAKALGKVASRVILVYPGPATMLQKHAEQFMGSRRLPEPLVLVRDEDMRMVEDWNLRWNAPRETAYPATFVIDKNGRVAWSMVSDSHAGRSTVEDIMKALRKL